MIGVLVFKEGEQVVKHAPLGFVVLVYISVSQQLHNHSEVLFFGWSFIVKIEYESQQKH